MRVFGIVVLRKKDKDAITLTEAYDLNMFGFFQRGRCVTVRGCLVQHISHRSGCSSAGCCSRSDIVLWLSCEHGDARQERMACGSIELRTQFLSFHLAPNVQCQGVHAVLRQDRHWPLPCRDPNVCRGARYALAPTSPSVMCSILCADGKLWRGATSLHPAWRSPLLPSPRVFDQPVTVDVTVKCAYEVR